MKVAIVGSRKWTNRRKILDFIGKCKVEFKGKLVIVSGGCKDGADRYAKDCALELGVKYAEFPPQHEPWNPYCVEPAFMFNKPYHVSNFHIRNKKIAEYSDRVIAFIPKGHVSKGTNSTLKFAKKCGTPSIIIN